MWKLPGPWSIVDANAQNRARELVLDAYTEYEERAPVGSNTQLVANRTPPYGGVRPFVTAAERP